MLWESIILPITPPELLDEAMRIGGSCRRWAVTCCCTGLLAACGSNDSASYLVDGTAEHALTLVRDKAYFWSGSWDLELVVANQPDCQRRHSLKPAAEGNFKLTVYRSGDGALILKQGKRWYVTDLRSCRLQQYAEQPPAPGEPIGIFEAKGAPLHFSLATAQSKADAGSQEEAPANAR